MMQVDVCVQLTINSDHTCLCLSRPISVLNGVTDYKDKAFLFLIQV